MDVKKIKERMKNMIVKGKTYESASFVPCPNYSGIGQVVDVTEPKEYETKFGTKNCIKFVIEIDKVNPEKKDKWVIFTRPMTLSLHPKAALRQFIDSISVEKPTEEEIEEGIDLENYVGRFVNLTIRQEKVDGKDQVYANIKFIEPAPEDVKTWESKWVRLADRPPKEKSDFGAVFDKMLRTKK